jgi:hypothetical protein
VCAHMGKRSGWILHHAAEGEYVYVSVKERERERERERKREREELFKQNNTLFNGKENIFVLCSY